MRILFLLLVCVDLIAQTSGPTFDAASIKPSPPLDTSTGIFNFGPGGGPGSANPGRFSCHYCVVSQLIGQAYNLPDYRVFSATRLPEGRFDLVATVPVGATREQFRMMLQHLLAERFKLAANRESREMQVFRLVVAPGGPNLKTHVEGAPRAERADTEEHPRSISYRVTGKTVADFARAVGSQLRRPVVDGTGLTGKYDFDLWWSVDDDPDGQSLSSAIRSLGLKLESHKDSVEVLVIKHVEKLPTEN